MENANTTEFNLPSLWEKIKDSAKRLGRYTTKKALLLYYVLKSDETPRSAKLIVYGSLAYLTMIVHLGAATDGGVGSDTFVDAA